MTSDPTPRVDPQIILDSLRRSVHKALERKRQLQQYAVIWKNNGPYYIGVNPPDDLDTIDKKLDQAQLTDQASANHKDDDANH